MYHAILISVIVAAVLVAACQRQDKPPKPVVSLLPLVGHSA